MPAVKQTLYITSQELCKILGINATQLHDIELLFDADPDDEWELIQKKDYKIVVASTGLREYTESGAYTIAKYLEAHPHKGFWRKLIDNITEWFLHTKKKINQSFVKSKILNNSSSLIKRSDFFFISKKDVVKILGTRSDYLKKMDEKARNTNFSLIKDEDYQEIDGDFYYSLSGISKLSLVFAENLSVKNRREWCKDVSEVIEPQIDSIVKQIKERDKNMQKVMKYVKENIDKKTCQVTLEKKVPAATFQLTVHHLYSKNQYPHLIDNPTNLITIKSEVHDQFHFHFMGGADKVCTIDNFIAFVQSYYPENSDLVIKLQSRKIVLGDQQPLGRGKSHVLYLPLSHVT